MSTERFAGRHGDIILDADVLARMRAVARRPETARLVLEILEGAARDRAATESPDAA